MAVPGRGLTVLVVDDEAPAREELAFLLSRDDLVGEVVVVARAEDALRRLGGGDVDVVLSDVHMPGLDGLDLTRAVARLAAPPAVVFVTAHDEHAVAAFDLQVADYVLKPVRAARLAAALRRATATTGGDPGRAAGEADETLSVELGGVTRFVQRSSVLWAEAQGDYVRLHTATDSHLLRSTLQQLEERWRPAGFVRIHRSLLVAVAAVRELRSDDGRHSVVLEQGPTRRELPVARRHAREVRERLVDAAGAAPDRS
ncbi:LytR/AlgR family response regulator transcription factor [Jannaschia sp. R86511]|uniref:LytR/AlgR family response regulator transcription factor n=1 Tax=Jannaschia sp. R86511 TaxID=3093853 RepID=UPI0036D433A6